MRDPIIITGCARSGTSMTAGIINICGAFGGDMFGPNQFNQKGMFENKNIRQNICKPYLRKIGVDLLGQKPLPNKRQVFEVNEREVSELRSRVILGIQSEGYIDGPWFYKGAKACLVWYIWHLAFPKAKWIIVRRKDEDIIRSCFRTRFMRAYNDRTGWQKWINTHKRRFQEMKEAGLNVIEFWPTTMCEGNYEPAKEMINSLGLHWKDTLCRTFIDPSLYNEVA